LIEEQVSGSGEADLPIFPPIIITVVLCGVVEGRSLRQDRRQRLCPQDATSQEAFQYGAMARGTGCTTALRACASSRHRFVVTPKNTSKK
jgi:hypothetical protein